MIKRHKLNLFNKVIAIMAIVFAVLSLIISSFFIVYMRVPVNGLSMYPTLNYDQQFTSKCDIVYINRFKTPSKNDIVVLDLTSNPNFGNYAIKRLVATEGDVVNIIANVDHMEYQLLVNGDVVDCRPIFANQINECATYTNFVAYMESIDDNQKNENGLIIGPGQIFVLGDNWTLSKDSSIYGAFNKDTIVGRVDFVAKSSRNELVELFKQIFN